MHFRLYFLAPCLMSAILLRGGTWGVSPTLQMTPPGHGVFFGAPNIFFLGPVLLLRGMYGTGQEEPLTIAHGEDEGT